MVERYDAYRIASSKVRNLAAGGIAIPAAVARTGIQVYTRKDGKKIREYRPKDEVFNADSLSTYDCAPVTIGHPRKFVDPTNWGVVAQGVTKLQSVEPLRIDKDDYVQAELAVTRADALKRIEAKELVEISVGYTCDVEPTSGVTPDGEHYDAIQRNVRVNHVALLPENSARAGKHARLRMDGAQEPPDLDPEENVKLIELDGIEYEFGSESHISALNKLLSEAQDEVTRLAEKLAAATTKLATAEAELDELQEKEDADDSSELEARVDAIVEFRAALKPHLPEGYEFKGKSEHDVRVDALKNLGVKRDEEKLKDEAYVKAALDLKLEALAAGPLKKVDYNRLQKSKTKKEDDELDPLDLSGRLLRKANKEMSK